MNVEGNRTIENANVAGIYTKGQPLLHTDT